MDRAPRKSLAIPNKTPPDDYKAYVEHPEVATLNQIMLHYLDIEEILKLYRQDHEQFETRQTLDTLAQRFDLPAAVDFKQLLKAYDMKYATVRSYLYNNRTPRQILMNAAFEGNIQAFYNQLKLYPELRNEKLYTTALRYAAKGGHEAIMELLFELGAKDKGAVVLINAALGGHLAIVHKELAKGVEDEYVEDAVADAASHRHREVVAALLDYSTTDKILVEAMDGAGRSGDISIIEYVISRGGNNYVSLIEGASSNTYFDIVREYWNKLDNPTIEFADRIFSNAINHLDLAMVKFLVKRKLLSQSLIEKRLGRLEKRLRALIDEKRKDNLYLAKYGTEIAAEIEEVTSIISYLERKGVVNS